MPSTNGHMCVRGVRRGTCWPCGCSCSASGSSFSAPFLLDLARRTAGLRPRAWTKPDPLDPLTIHVWAKRLIGVVLVIGGILYLVHPPAQLQ